MKIEVCGGHPSFSWRSKRKKERDQACVCAHISLIDYVLFLSFVDRHQEKEDYERERLVERANQLMLGPKAIRSLITNRFSLS